MSGFVLARAGLQDICIMCGRVSIADMYVFVSVRAYFVRYVQLLFISCLSLLVLNRVVVPVLSALCSVLSVLMWIL